MINTVKETIKKYNMISSGDTIVVGLSGGSDSMCLLNILLKLSDEFKFTLEAAHIDHGLRGKESNADREFVTAYCNEHSIPLYTLIADVKGRSEKSGEGLEEAGRKIRYEFFASLGKDKKIATAHNRSDRIETFLFNFTRGASLKGLCSIPPVRGNIIRPIIDIEKKDIEKYCVDNNIPFVTDKSNTDVKYSRNRIRHNCITELEKINSSFQKCGAECIDNINDDEKYLSDMAADAVINCKIDSGYLISKLCSLPSPILRRCIYYILSSDFSLSPTSLEIKAIIEALFEYKNSGKGRIIELPKNIYLRTRAGLLEKVTKFNTDNLSTKTADNCIIFGNNKIKFSVVNKTEIKYSQITSLYYVIDYDKIDGEVNVRGYESGDIICTPKRNITKKLRKIYNEMKIPPEERPLIPVIYDNNGVLCVKGIGIDKAVMVDSNTEKLLIIEFFVDEE